MSSENQNHCTHRRLSEFPATVKPFIVQSVVRTLNDTTAKFLFILFCTQDVNYHGICVTTILKNSTISRVICLLRCVSEPLEGEGSCFTHHCWGFLLFFKALPYLFYG